MGLYYCVEKDIGECFIDNHDNALDIEGFALMLKNPSYSYKYYWLEALVTLISEDRLTLSLDEIIDEMIASAWHAVCGAHIHLSGMQSGEVRDGLERAVKQLAELSNLPADASYAEIKTAITSHNHSLHKCKEQLTHMVPYRALAGFLDRAGYPVSWENKSRLLKQIRYINDHLVLLPYIFGQSKGLKREIYVHPAWAQMIIDNIIPVRAWVRCEKIQWLQLNNPEIPAVARRLSSGAEAALREKKINSLPQLDRRAGRKSVYEKYTQGQIAEVVYGYLYEAKTHRQLDREILGLDSKKTKGFQSFGALNYLGLDGAFKGIFQGKTLAEGIATLDDAGEDYTEVVNVLNSKYSCHRITDNSPNKVQEKRTTPLPLLDRSAGRKGVYEKYTQKQIAEVVYGYLYEAKTHRQLDREILGLDSKKTKGFQSFGVLNYLGLNGAFKGILQERELAEGIEIFKNAGEEYAEVANILSSMASCQRITDEFQDKAKLQCVAKKKTDEVPQDDVIELVLTDYSMHGAHNKR